MRGDYNFNNKVFIEFTKSDDKSKKKFPRLDQHIFYGRVNMSASVCMVAVCLTIFAMEKTKTNNVFACNFVFPIELQLQNH